MIWLLLLLRLHAPGWELSVRPTFCLSPCQVTVTLRYYGPIPEVDYCPAVEWEWPDGTHSREESDCPPWVSGVEEPRSWSRSRPVAGQGDADVPVRVSKAGRTLWRRIGVIRVRGGFVQ